MRAKRGASSEALGDRPCWGSLGDVAPSTRLITQRSLVQIQAPQPRKIKGFRRNPGAPWRFGGSTGAARQLGRTATTHVTQERRGTSEAFEFRVGNSASSFIRDRPPRGGLSRRERFATFTTLPYSFEPRSRLFGSHLTRSQAGTTLVCGCYRSRRLLHPCASRRNAPTRAG
jgi:hypothetical protein